MSDVLVPLMWLLAIVPTLALLVFTAEVWLGIASTRAIEITGETPDICILVPAHNEASIIVQTLERLRPLISSTTRALIVADNCSDNTAELVREQEFPVIERFDTEQRGKGFALAFGRDHLRSNPPDCIIVMDADCHTDPQAISDLARKSCSARAAIQARYIFDPAHVASPKVQISNFALWIKNVVRQRGSARLGGAAVLTGTGMAFPWDLFERMPLATGSIVEDLSLTVDLTLAGDAPLFLDQALVLSDAAGEQATLGQRSRWEHGFLAVAGSYGLPLVRHGLFRLDRRALLLGLHLLVPPFALLIMLCLFMSVLLAGGAVLTGNWSPFAVLATSFATALLGVLINWALEGRAWLHPKALLFFPVYILWKIPLYARFLVGKRAGWTRTERE